MQILIWSADEIQSREEQELVKKKSVENTHTLVQKWNETHQLVDPNLLYRSYRKLCIISV
jgi:hypothetical protein